VFSIFLRGLDAVLGGWLGFVSLTGQDDLPVGDLRAETEFPALVFDL
jgi:hypothetical protein